MKPFKRSKALDFSAKDHVDYIGPIGSCHPLGENGTLPNERIEKYCSFGSTWAESISFNGVKSKQILEYLIVCDGIPSRGNRKNIFSKEVSFMGLSVGPHTEFTSVCVVDWAQKVGKVGELNNIEI